MRLQPAACVVPDVGADPGADAGTAAGATLTIAGAPSFRLSNFAASTGTSCGNLVFSSTRPAASSRRPVTTLRLTSLPFSTVHTYVCPASMRTAVAGNVSTGPLAASAIRPVANIPPRSAPSVFGIPT